MILALLIALIAVGSSQGDGVRREKELYEQIHQLQEQNQKLNRKQDVKRRTIRQPTRPVSSERLLSFSGGKQTIAKYILAKFGKDGKRMLAVAKCESGLNTNAVGSHYERGIFQIHPVHANSMTRVGFKWEEMFNWKKNIDYAYVLFKYQGYKPWTCANYV